MTKHDDKPDAGAMLLSPEDAALVLGVAEGTLANWRAAGKGPPFVRVGRKVMYRMESLEDWLLEREVSHD